MKCYITATNLTKKHMKVHNFADSPSLVSQYLAEMRNRNLQTCLLYTSDAADEQ